MNWLSRVRNRIVLPTWHPVVQCRVCQWACKELGTAFNRLWYQCEDCELLQVRISTKLWHRIHLGEGEIAGTAASGNRTPGFRPGSADGGFREYFLAKLCFDDLHAERILLYGTAPVVLPQGGPVPPGRIPGACGPYTGPARP